MKSVYYDDNKIYINGTATKLVSGAMHYFRIHPDYWNDRLLKLKEAGCNCVETYVCWNLHEKTEGEFDFSGWLDLGKFIDMANSMGLYAIVRPGPYICSEWDFGGLPWWILKYGDIELRCNNDRFKKVCVPYLEKVCEIIKPRLITNGGNIIFVQIENEYGSYGNDKEYLGWMKALYENNGIDCGFLTSDGETELLLKNGTLDGVLATVNYRKDSERCIGMLKKHVPNQPGAVLELWNGRAMQWGEKFERRNVEEVKESVRTALEYAELINMYMFHGGTNFGFMNGSLDLKDNFKVQMSSYDVDAPLDEYGRRTPKYYAEQEVICKAMGKEIENTATDTTLTKYKDITFVGECSLKESGVEVESLAMPMPKPMELCDQGYGYIVYETTFFADSEGATIRLPEIHDFSHVYVDGEYVTSFHRHSENKNIDVTSGNHTIAILVENMGRINYGVKLKDYKGILGNIILHDKLYDVENILLGLTVYKLPLETLPESYSGKAEENTPAFYKYELTVGEISDTVMHFEGFTRGVAFINGFNLGRHWTVENSENKLFIPAPFIKQGVNEIVVFDVLHNTKEKKISFGEFK
ncbi:MAG: beta-galactosidase [Ruminococcaceae bacterium]|nr:beta-galactosidase [Oscillospiraceae bacterium]